MADTGDKTEEPTGKRLEEAREKGQIAKSPELATAAFLLGFTLTLGVAGPPLWRFLVDTMQGTLGGAADPMWDAAALPASLQTVAWRTLAALGGILVTAVVIAIGTHAAQVGPLWSTKAITPDFARMNPLTGFQRFVSPRSLVELAKSLGKLALMSAVVWITLRRAADDVQLLALLPPVAVTDIVRRYGISLIRNAGLLFLVLAAVDYGYQRWQRLRDLRMTKQEVKDEAKNADADPELKARRRAIARDRIRRQMLKDVATADVVIVNPVHIAVAIKYDPMVAPAPWVVALGERKVAERIKAIAFDAGVPVVENIPLARALIRTAKLGSMIPVELYVTVAEVLAFVLRQRQRRPSAWAGAAVA